VKTLPTVAASPDHAIEILAFEGQDRIPNRDATGFYYTIKMKPDATTTRVAVLFSGTVFFVDTAAFGLPRIEDQGDRFCTYAEAAIGDYLTERGLPEATPSGTSVFKIECFSPHFLGGADRNPASDDLFDDFLRQHLYAAWQFGHGGWELGLSDCLRLHQPLGFVERMVRLGEGKDWEVARPSANSLQLRPMPDFLRQRRASRSPAPSARPGPDVASDMTVVPAEYVFVDELRIAELRSAKSTRFDLRKLIAICEELNLCYRSQCYYAVAALTRTLLDHVPPIFSCNTFAEVANNYNGGKSFRGCMQHLEITARSIADMHLHGRIRDRETLPTRAQVAFAPEVDILLAEVARLLVS
jgi:hypothetical protein